MSCIHIPHIKPDESIEQILSALLSVIHESLTSKSDIKWQFYNNEKNDLFLSLLYAFTKTTDVLTEEPELGNSTIAFELNDESISKTIDLIENNLFKNPNLSQLRQVVSYLLNELVCNVQQHSHANVGIIHASFNKSLNVVDICVADNGISIYGSYVNAQKYLEQISNSAEALAMARKGYSTKNLPNAENRGYGISSNAKMIVRGLNGTFSILSDNALFHFTKESEIIEALSETIVWNGTVVIARIPIAIPDSFNIYNYIA